MALNGWQDYSFSSCDVILPSEIAEEVYKNTKILGILSIITSSLSIVGTSSVVIFVLYKRICRSPDVNPLFHLSIADFLLALFWVIGPIIHFKYHKAGLTTDLSYFCSTWQGLCEMVHIMSFFLTVNYALNVFLRMKEKKDRMFQLDDPTISQEQTNRLDWFKSATYLFSWILPVALVIPLLIEMRKGDTTSCQQCIILLDAPRPVDKEGDFMRYNGCILMVAALAFSITSIIVLYIQTLRMYRKTLLGFRTNRQRVVIHAMAKRAAVYIAVFMFCWTPALILASLRWRRSINASDGYPMIKYFGLYVLQTLSAPLQGFLNSLVYGWSRKTFRDAVTRESRQLLAAGRARDYGSRESPSLSFNDSGETT